MHLLVVFLVTALVGLGNACSVDQMFSDIEGRIAILERSLKDEITRYTCYDWTSEELAAFSEERTPEEEKAQCESHYGGVYTHGANDNFPGCGSCDCCIRIEYECYSWNADDLAYIHAAYSVAREKERCESHPFNSFSQGNNETHPGCGGCWCCHRLGILKGKHFVGFTAYLSYFTDALPVDKPLVLDRTLLNEGNGYDTKTGIFTAPVSGYYSFTFSVETRADTESSIVVRLSVDGVNTLNVVTEPRHNGQNLSGSNAGVLRLNKGQKVWLEPYQVANQKIEGGDSWRFTTFAGALLQEV